MEENITYRNITSCGTAFINEFLKHYNIDCIPVDKKYNNERTTNDIKKFEEILNKLSDDLGLWLERETPFDFEVKNDDDKVIKFNKERREIACFNYYDGFEYLTLQELQAINKKCKELGWIE